VILRNQSKEKHLFIGCAYIHGIMDGEVLLGPVPEDFTLVVDDEGEVLVEKFRHRTTGELTTQDPRLQPLSDDWQHIRTSHRLWPAKMVNAFQNNNTGDIAYADPRMSLEALRARGVPLQVIDLV
jgi:hypothetical protein